MINIVMHLDAEDTGMVNYERLYVATVGSSQLCKVRARSAKHAEDKLMACFLHELPGKTIDFNLEKYLGKEELPAPKREGEKTDEKPKVEATAKQGELGL